ncbi:MAG TPA: hypothetical protein VJY35_08995 [Candidatus Eisenbacteria bacterium]|nr:hypothetical protein [Candidatus Eisenbacteria bacterium]
MSRVSPSVARAVLLVLIVAGALAARSATADTGSIHFIAGAKNLAPEWFVSSPRTSAGGDTLLAGRVTQPSLGVEITWGRNEWPAMIALDVLHSYDDGLQHFPAINLGPLQIPEANVQRRARTIEIGLGARRGFSFAGLTPELGAGAVWVRGSVNYRMSDPSQGTYGALVSSLGAHETAIGFWASAGVTRRIGSRLEMGLRGRFSSAKLTLPEGTVLGRQGGYYFRGDPVEVEAGGRHLGLVVGWAFPTRK